MWRKNEQVFFVNVFSVILDYLGFLLKKRATCDRGHAQLARETCRHLRVTHRTSIASRHL